MANDYNETIQWYEDNALTYSQAISQSVDSDLINQFVSYLPPNAIILDAGCAAGRDAGEFAKRQVDYTGVDLSNNLLRIAKRNNPSLTFIQADFSQLPLPNNSFDGIWANASLVHLPSIRTVKLVISEFYRILKPGGTIFIRVKQQVGSTRTGVVSDSLVKQKRFFRWYTKAELQNYLKSAGFSILDVKDNQPSRTRSEVKWINVIGRKI